HPLLAEMRLERGAHAPGGFGVVADELILVERCDLRRPRRSGRLGLGLHDPRDRVEHVRADALVEGADVQLDGRLVGNHVLLVPACSAPIVTTADCAGATSRETIVCRRSTVAAAMTTGSMLARGRP